MECGLGQRLVRYWLETGYCRPATGDASARPFLESCLTCDLFGEVCGGNPYLLVDVEKALAVSVQRMGALDICRLPIRVSIGMPKVLPAERCNPRRYQTALS